MSSKNPNEPNITLGERIRGFIQVILILGASTALIYIDPAGKMLSSWITKAQDTIWDEALRFLLDIFDFLIGIAGLVVVIIVASFFSESSRAERKRPKFFEEMQSTLRSILIPVGFSEVEGSDNPHNRYVSFLRSPLRVILSLDPSDGIYSVYTTSVFYKDKHDKKPDDFSIEGTIFHPDGFKNQVLAKLNEWLVKRGVK